jgi:hypothetical protein
MCKREQTMQRIFKSAPAASRRRFSARPQTSRAGGFPVRCTRVASLLSLAALFVLHAAAQYTPPPPASQPGTPPPPPAPLVTPQQLDQLVARIALYPDSLLAQILTASTYWNQIPEAAAWANQHSYLTGDALAEAIRADNLQFDPSVTALLPFPSILNMMAQDMAWTQQLGNAVLLQRADVMDAIQRLRKRAYDFGYLRSNAYYNVVNVGNYIEIQPVNPQYIYIPMYDPVIVFRPPPPGFAISGAIHFGPAVIVGATFWPWGWAHPYLLWGPHEIIIDETPWRRVWVNRAYYFHPYEHPWVHRVGPRIERHEIHHR